MKTVSEFKTYAAFADYLWALEARAPKYIDEPIRHVVEDFESDYEKEIIAEKQITAHDQPLLIDYLRRIKRILAKEQADFDAYVEFLAKGEKHGK